MIEKVGRKWRVVSKKTDAQGHHKNLGESTTRAGAVKRLHQVEYFKHQKGKV
jgi:hypothetical protein